MSNDDLYRVKFEQLKPWIDGIFQVIKKDVKNEHLKKDAKFAAKHFPKCAFDKITTDELVQPYLQEVAEGNEELGEWLASRWILKHTDVYEYFVMQLSQINPDFDQIEVIPDAAAEKMIVFAVGHFGAAATYIFSVFNSARFSPPYYAKLREAALVQEKQEVVEPQGQSLEVVQKQLQKLTEKYEKKFQGLERKYIDDVAGLKKQIAGLHKKLRESAHV